MQLNMADKSYAMKMATEKSKKCTSQIFHFKNFVTEIFWNILRDFQKCEIMRIDHFLGPFTTRYCQIRPEIHMPWQLAYKNTNMYISDYSFLNLYYTNFCKANEEIFRKKCHIMKTYQQSGGISNRSYSKSFICSDKLDGLKQYCVLSDFVPEMHFWLHIFEKYFHRFSITVKIYA